MSLLLATVALTWPTVRYLTTHVVDRQDPLLNTWIMAWEAHQLLRAPLRLFDANIFFPYENTLAFSETLLGITVLVLPLRWAGISALGTYNVAFLLSFFLTAVGAYLLATFLSHSRQAGLLAALAYAFHPYRFGHLSQLQLLATGWLPLTLLYLDRCLREQPPRARNAVLLAVFFALQALSSFYSALFTATACLAYAVGWWGLTRARPSWRTLAQLGGAAALVTVAVAPVAWPYVEVNRTLGASWSLETNERFSASLQAYLYAPPETPLWGPLTARFAYTYGPCCPPDTLFPGLTLVTLSALALKGERDRRKWLYALLLLVGFTLSLGPTLHLQAGTPTGIPLPYRWLFRYAPGFQSAARPGALGAVGHTRVECAGRVGHSQAPPPRLAGHTCRAGGIRGHSGAPCGGPAAVGHSGLAGCPTTHAHRRAAFGRGVARRAHPARPAKAGVGGQPPAGIPIFQHMALAPFP
ncbi:MAG: hypothetical protein Q9O62_00255 [Ardenticatenia bacterium]|nr:hypothetical protein [Ardenticatenia bacterium]